MSEASARDLSCAAKIARVVLENCGPLAPSEVAEEAYVSRAKAERGLEELAEADLAKAVCGVCSCKEEVYELTEADDEAKEPSA